MIVLEGAPALSPFRRERLQARLNAIAPALRIVDTRHGYWVDPEPGASPDRAALRRILIDLIEEYARHTGHADLIRVVAPVPRCNLDVVSL